MRTVIGKNSHSVVRFAPRDNLLNWKASGPDLCRVLSALQELITDHESPITSSSLQLSPINFPVPVFAPLLLSVIATKIAIAMGQIRFRRNVPVNAAANDS